MFIGVSGNAPFLETYWRHIFLTYPLALPARDFRPGHTRQPERLNETSGEKRYNHASEPDSGPLIIGYDKVGPPFRPHLAQLEVMER